ncbi:uncharacterized protein LOC124252971 isoform X2 [Haliotis rubra]|nr:uncharacterized protein LOC124252971 isoform X2 [Haliotis rubra]
MSLRKWYKDQPDYGNRSHRVPAEEGPTYLDIKEKLQGRVKYHKERAKEWKEEQDNLEKERRNRQRTLRSNLTHRGSETPRGKHSSMIHRNIRVHKDTRNVLCPPSYDDYKDRGDRVPGTRWTLVRYYETGR